VKAIELGKDKPVHWTRLLSPEDLETVCQLQEKFSSLYDPQDLDRYLDQTLHALTDKLGFYGAGLYLLQDEAPQLHLRAHSGLTALEAGAFHTLGDMGDLIGRVALTGEIGRGDDGTQDSSGARRRCSTAVPLLIRDQIVGVLAAHDEGGEQMSVPSSTSRAPTTRNEIMLQILARALASSLYQSQLLNWSQKRIERTSVLNEIARALSAKLEIDQLLEAIYQQVGRVIDTASYFVALFEPDTERLQLEILIDEGTRFPKREAENNGGLAWWVIRNRQALRLNDLLAGMQHLGLKPLLVGQPRLSQSWMGVPMIVGEQLIGVLAVASYEKDAFDEEDEEFLSNIAAQAAVAIENARLYEETRQQLSELRRTQERMISMARLAVSAELAAGLGHEVNNALTPILGVTQLALRRHDLGSDLRADLENVMSSAQRIRSIVQTFSEMSSGCSLARQPTDLNTVFQQAMELFEWQFQRAGVQVPLDLSESLPTVACDRAQLRQVFANILLNSLEAMPRGGTIHISSYREGRFACIQIQDTGAGISASDLNHVFEPWFTTKVEAGRTRGLGLGLFSAYNIVHAHGGRIDLQSEPGKGTTVKVCMPAERSK
jgi:signal transduction histidine kinase